MSERRATHAAGLSWRKWQDPLMYGAPGARHSFVGLFLFFALCAEVGAVLGLVAATFRWGWL